MWEKTLIKSKLFTPVIYFQEVKTASDSPFSFGDQHSSEASGGRGNDFIYVENDEVSDAGGENTFLVTGSGIDDITLEPGINVIVIDKTSGS